MAFVFGDTYGGVYQNLLGTQEADVRQQNLLDQTARADQQRQFENQLQLQQLQNQAGNQALAQQQWMWSKADTDRMRKLEEAKFDWTKAQGAGEKAREFDVNTAWPLAQAGVYDDEQHVARDWPNLRPQDHKALAQASQDARKALTAEFNPIADDAETLNYAQQIQAVIPDDPTVAEAAKIMQDKKRMGVLRHNPQTGMWEPAVTRPKWMGPAAAQKGMETVTPGEMEDIESQTPNKSNFWGAVKTGAGALPGAMGPLAAARIWQWAQQPTATAGGAAATPQVSVVSPKSLPVGQKVRQNGVTYQFNGTAWVPVL